MGIVDEWSFAKKRYFLALAFFSYSQLGICMYVCRQIAYYIFRSWEVYFFSVPLFFFFSGGFFSFFLFLLYVTKLWLAIYI